MGAVSIYTAFTDNTGDTTSLSTTAFDLTDFDFTDDEIAKATTIQVTVSGQICRYTYNASTPVATGVGHIIPDGGTVLIDGRQNIAGFRIVADSASAIVTVTLFE